MIKQSISFAKTDNQQTSVVNKARVDLSSDNGSNIMADCIMRIPDTPVFQRKCTDCEEKEKINRKPLSSQITPFVQRKSNGGNVTSANVSSRIQSCRGGGNPLPSPTKNFMESRFGTDFSDVRIHTGSEASTLSRGLNAKAFTVGRDVYFNKGLFMPETNSGKRLLAHELTHVVQQGVSDRSRIQRTSLTGTKKGTAGLHEDLTRRYAQEVGIPYRGGLQYSDGYREWLSAQRTTGGGATGSGSTPCATSVSIGGLHDFNHSSLSTTDKDSWRTYLGVASSMNVGPGPDHNGHCMKEQLTLVSNNCPAQVYERGGETISPCTGNKCLSINRYGQAGDGLTGSMASDGPTSFIDLHRTRNQEQSLLEGSGQSSCTVVCEQIYLCDRTGRTTGRFHIRRNYRAGQHTKSDGTDVHITTGSVDKIVAPSP